jgi:hypothetical protein
MKKLFAVIVMLVMLIGCAGMNASVPVNIASDAAFVLVIQNNPGYKVPIIAGLNKVKAFLSGTVTYDDLLIEIAKVLPSQYAVVAVILSGYLDTDKPIFETYLPMLDSYKEGVIVKIDRFIFLATNM